MFWCWLFLVVVYIACCCLDGCDLKPRWKSSLACALDDAAGKLSPTLHTKHTKRGLVVIRPKAVTIGVSLELSEFDLMNPILSQPHHRERLLRDCDVRIADGISRELLRRNLISFNEYNEFGGIRKVGTITIYKNEDI